MSPLLDSLAVSPIAGVVSLPSDRLYDQYPKRVAGLEPQPSSYLLGRLGAVGNIYPVLLYAPSQPAIDEPGSHGLQSRGILLHSIPRT